jgi:pyroglutamyl-peptidase
VRRTLSSLILASFEPFGGRRVNRSTQAAQRVRSSAGAVLEHVVLPVDFARLARLVPRLVARRPRALLLVGEARKTRRVLVECIALNVIDARIADNARRRPRRMPVQAGGPLALAARCDAPAVLAALKRVRIPARLSYHAGTFACNAGLYLALAAAAGRRGAPAVAFLHVPARGGPTIARLARGLEAALAVMGGRASDHA